MNFSFDGKQDRLILIRDGFEFPSMSEQVQYYDSEHSNRRRERRSTRVPFSFAVPIAILNDRNQLTRDEVMNRVNQMFYSDGPKKFKVKDSDWHFVGRFNGPYMLPNKINAFYETEVEFTSEYSHKFYDEERTQTTGTTKRVTINSKTQIPTVPLIELTGLSGTDVQVSISGDSFRRIRLSGNLTANLTIDIENETIYETNSGVNRLNLLRIDSSFEDFKIKNGDVVVLTNAGSNASAKLTYKELLL